MAFNFLTNFHTELKRYCLTEIPTDYVQRQINIILDLRRRVIARTPTAGHPLAPYATGHAKANWQVSKRWNDGTIKGSRNNPAGILTEQQIRVNWGRLGKSRIKAGSAQLGFGNAGAYDHYELFNNVEYIQFLEDGNSNFAPWGILEISVMENRMWAQGLIN